MTINRKSALTEGVPGYRILGILGEGGMGIVWEAEHEQTKQRVASRSCAASTPSTSNTGGRSNAKRKLWRALNTRISRPSTIPVTPTTGTITFRWRSCKARPWIVGSPAGLRSRYSRTQSAPAPVLHHLRRGALRARTRSHPPRPQTLQHRHQRPGIVPATMTRGGRNPTAKILDFGLASLTDPDLETTARSEIGIIKGTLQYMSPEQARCDGEPIGVRSDVYALGVILYELLVGRRPYDVSISALAEALRAICEQRPRPLRNHWVGPARLDADLATIVEKALEKEVDRRYATVAGLGHDIESYLRSEPITARPRSAAYRLKDHMAPTLEPVVEGAAVATVAVGNAVVSTAQKITRIARIKVW